MAGLMTESIIAFEYQPILLKVARDKLLRSNKKKTLVGINKLIKWAAGQADWARKQKMSDFADINRHSIVSIWGALEACIEDTIVLILINDHHRCYKLLLESGISIKESYENGITESQARKIYKAIERKIRERYNAGEGFVNILKIFEIEVVINCQILLILDEINEVRNCILHNSGRINEKAAKKIPALEKHIYSEFIIDRKKCSEYFDSIRLFLSAIFKGISKSEYLFPKLEDENI